MSFKDKFLHLIGLEEVKEDETSEPLEDKILGQKLLKLIGVEIIEEDQDENIELK